MCHFQGGCSARPLQHLVPMVELCLSYSLFLSCRQGPSTCASWRLLCPAVAAPGSNGGGYPAQWLQHLEAIVCSLVVNRVHQHVPVGGCSAWLLQHLVPMVEATLPSGCSTWFQCLSYSLFLSYRQGLSSYSLFLSCRQGPSTCASWGLLCPAVAALV